MNNNQICDYCDFNFETKDQSLLPFQLSSHLFYQHPNEYDGVIDDHLPDYDLLIWRELTKTKDKLVYIFPEVDFNPYKKIADAVLHLEKHGIVEQIGETEHQKLFKVIQNFPKISPK